MCICLPQESIDSCSKNAQLSLTTPLHSSRNFGRVGVDELHQIYSVFVLHFFRQGRIHLYNVQT